ncbi:MAG: hypothetical protein K2X91_17440 [Thermoleophilia bacterium]|nr:hypothetical protein [Thermoleophilia bacterium]
MNEPDDRDETPVRLPGAEREPEDRAPGKNRDAQDDPDDPALADFDMNADDRGNSFDRGEEMKPI